MITLWAGLIVFFGAHAMPMFSEPRGQFIQKYNEMTYKALIAVVSLAGLVLISWGYAEARESPILVYTSPPWLRAVSLLLMIPVFILFVAAYLKGKIKQLVKHPMFLAIKIWAIAHLLVNGTVADIVLFTSFLVWAVLALIAANKRARASGTDAPKTQGSFLYDGVALIVGLGLYVAFVIRLHEYLIGVSPVG